MQPLISHLLSETDNQLHLCFTFILVWIAKANGEIQENEREVIFEHIKANGDVPWSEIINIIDRRDIESFVLVCEVLRHSLSDEQKQALISLCIMVAVADNRLGISELHILRFIADLMGFSAHHFKSIFSEIAGTELPKPGDPSSVQWWESKKKRLHSNNDGSSREFGNSNYYRDRPSNNGITREEACAILGVQSSASAAEIKKAYKRLAYSHHPDRFTSLGSDSAEVDLAMFVRIQEAYKVLKS